MIKEISLQEAPCPQKKRGGSGFSLPVPLLLIPTASERLTERLDGLQS